MRAEPETSDMFIIACQVFNHDPPPLHFFFCRLSAVGQSVWRLEGLTWVLLVWNVLLLSWLDELIRALQKTGTWTLWSFIHSPFLCSPHFLPLCVRHPSRLREPAFQKPRDREKGEKNKWDRYSRSWPNGCPKQNCVVVPPPSTHPLPPSLPPLSSTCYWK